MAPRQTSAAHVLTTKTLEVPMTLRRLLFGIAVFSISFVAITTKTHAKDQDGPQRSQYAKSSKLYARSVKLSETKKLRLPSKQGRAPGISVALSKHKLEKLIKLASKRCGCASPAQDTEFSMSCVRSCVARYVGWSTVLACGTACMGNPAGCAFCVGVHEWVVLGCVQYCVWGNVFSVVDGPVSSNRGRPSTKRHAKSLVRSTGSVSSS